MATYAMIEATRQDNGQYVYRWIGEPNWPVKITYSLLKDDPGLLSRLPWTLVQISAEGWNGAATYRRADQVGPSEHKGCNHD